MTSTMLRNRTHPLILGVAVVVALVSLVAVVMTGALPGGSSPQDHDPTAKSATPARPAPAGDAGSEGRAARGNAPAACPGCGTVEAIRTVELRADPTGSQEPEQHPNKRIVYRVTVRLDDGSYRTLSQAAPPSIAVGEKVRIVDGAVVARP